jgi:uracil-DNA glycosylase family 4
MLAEMGVRVWQPTEVKAAKVAVEKPLQAMPDMPSQPALQQAASAPIPTLTPVRREPPLRLPVLSSPPAALNATPARYVIGNMPAESAAVDYILLGELCSGDAEKLLANMTKALGGSVFLAQMVAMQTDAESLAEQLASLSAKVLVALGPHAAKALLGEAASSTPFGKLRGVVHSAHASDRVKAKVIVTYHPLQLLRPPKPKAQAWQDLKLAIRLVSCA